LKLAWLCSINQVDFDAKQCASSLQHLDRHFMHCALRQDVIADVKQTIVA